MGLCSTVAITVLFFISYFSSCYISSDDLEMTFFCDDNTVLNFVVLAAFIAILYIVKRKGLIERLTQWLSVDSNYQNTKNRLLFVIFLLGTIWVFSTQYVPGSDQMDVVSSAEKLRSGETNMLEPGGYLDRYNNQLGLAIIEYYLGAFWGDFNLMAFQLLNVVGLTLLYKKIVDILEHTDTSRLIQICALICGVGFFPLIMYTSFVYGTIWSVTLALLTFDMECKFLNDYRWWRIPLCALYMAFAIQVKNNVWILFIALEIYTLIFLLEDKEKIIRSAVMLFAVCLVALVVSKMPKYWISQKTGYELDQGITSWAFIAMGLQEGDKAPGWWNTYNYESYDQNSFNSYAQSIEAKAEIQKSIDHFKSDKGYAYRFFIKKIASMWTEPTYQSFWISQIRNHRVTLPDWIEKSMTVQGYTVAARMLDCVQPIFLLGILLWIIFEEKEAFNKHSLFLLAFLGGFIFHLFWEEEDN